MDTQDIAASGYIVRNDEISCCEQIFCCARFVSYVPPSVIYSQHYISWYPYAYMHMHACYCIASVCRQIRSVCACLCTRRIPYTQCTRCCYTLWIRMLAAFLHPLYSIHALATRHTMQGPAPYISFVGAECMPYLQQAWMLLRLLQCITGTLHMHTPCAYTIIPRILLICTAYHADGQLRLHLLLAHHVHECCAYSICALCTNSACIHARRVCSIRMQCTTVHAITVSLHAMQCIQRTDALHSRYTGVLCYQRMHA